MFFISEVRKIFTQLRQAFVEATILNYSDPERYIYIKIDVFTYAIGRILN